MQIPVPATESDDRREGLGNRRNSGTWSIISAAKSIFSTQSAISGSSASSLNTSHDMIERLVGLFLEDDTIKSVCLDALVAIPRVRFERNLRRLLMTFATELRQEAATEGEQNAARFVQHRARNSAHLICNRLGHPSKAKGPMELNDDDDEVSDESESNRSEGNPDSIHQLEAFIKMSKALNSLRNSLDLFVRRVIDSDTQNKPEDEKCKATETLLKAGLPFPADEHSKTLATGINEPTASPNTSQMRSRMQMLTLYSAQFARRAVHSLEIISLLRPSLAHGKTRVEWQCVSAASLTYE